jgi:hypothetical protein
VVQALPRQQHKQHKSCKVGNAVPMHGKRADGQGHGVELGMYQHAQYCAAGKDRIELILNSHPQTKKQRKINYLILK